MTLRLVFKALHFHPYHRDFKLRLNRHLIIIGYFLQYYLLIIITDYQFITMTCYSPHIIIFYQIIYLVTNQSHSFLLMC